MALVLYGHPLSSFTHKVLVAFYDLGTPFEFRLLDPTQAGDRDLIAGLTPLGKFPALRDADADVTVAESSVIIGYLDALAGGGRLVPRDAAAARDVQVWDRVFDMHVQGPMQSIVDARLFMDKAAEPGATAHARGQLDRAYSAIEVRLQATGDDWIAGDFSMADCAALPALFYAGILHPFADHPRLSAWFERLIARPSAARVLDEARPWFDLFPFRDMLPARFL